MNTKQFFEAIEYKITEGSKFMWDCYGPNAWTFESWEGPGVNIPSASMVINTTTHEVCEAEVHDYIKNRAYRWINPAYKSAYETECQNRNIDPKEAYDDIMFTDLDCVEDFLAKTTAILRGEEYDDRVTINIDIDDDTLFFAMLEAHKQDITLNKFIENVLREAIENDGFRQKI